MASPVIDSTPSISQERAHPLAWPQSVASIFTNAFDRALAISIFIKVLYPALPSAPSQSLSMSAWAGIEPLASLDPALTLPALSMFINVLDPSARDTLHPSAILTTLSARRHLTRYGSAPPHATAPPEPDSLAPGPRRRNDTYLLNTGTCLINDIS